MTRMDEIEKLAMETAAYEGNIDAIKDAIEHKGLLFETNVIRYIISIVISQEYYHILDYFIKHGISLNEPNEYGITPLAGAVCAAHYNGVKYLLEKGIPANQLSPEGNSLLFYAIDAEVEEANAKRGPHDRDGDRPMPEVNVTDILIKFGADAHSRSSIGKTPLEFAIYLGHKKAEELIRRVTESKGSPS